jgi:hypothetical protein
MNSTSTTKSDYLAMLSDLDPYKKATLIALVVSILYFCWYYFVLCNLPFIGTPTFRIDYLAASLSRGDSLLNAVTDSRPVNRILSFFQTRFAIAVLHGDTSYGLYLTQYLAVFVYFFCVASTINYLFKANLGVLALVAGFGVFAMSPEVISSIYKLETIVGSRSMLFGGLSLLVLMRWDRDRKHIQAAGFFFLYALSIFSKEDFALPPLLLLGWMLVRNGNILDQVRTYKYMLISAGAVLLFFLIYNEWLIKGHAFIDPVNVHGSPYFMSLSPSSLFRVAKRYIVGFDDTLAAIFIVYVLAAVALFISGKHRRENILVALIIGGLMAPYLIMPNHVFDYYATKWIAWQIMLVPVAIKLICPQRTIATALTAGLAAAAFSLTILGIMQHRAYQYYQSAYLRTHFNISRNMKETLERNRLALNAYDTVAITGIARKDIGYTPWQNNGEFSSYLTRNLGLDSNWILYVPSASPSVHSSKDSAGESTRKMTGKVQVESLARLNARTDLPVLAFNKDGTGRLLPPGSPH